MITLLNILSLLFFLIAALFVALGRYLWDAALLFFLSLVAFIITQFRKGESDSPVGLVIQRYLPKSRAGWLRWVAVFVSLFVSLSALTLPVDANYAWLFIFWCAAILVFTGTLLKPILQKFQQLLPEISKLETGCLVVLILITAIVRGARVGSIPANLGGDEGSQLLFGYRLVSAPFGNPFATGWFSVPTMSFALYGLTMRLWGATIAGGRMLSVIAGTLCVLFTFLLGRSLAGRRFAWIAAILVAFSAFHIHYSRLASNQIFDPLIGTATFWLIHIALNQQRDGNHGVASSLWGLAGLTAGFGWYAYFGARWVSFMLILYVIWQWLFQRDFLNQHKTGIILFILGWIVMTLPLWFWYYEHPSAFTERYNAVSIFSSGWLVREVGITGKSAARLMLEQFWKSATAFHLTPDPTFWYYPQKPLADIVTGFLMIIGIIACASQVRWPSKALTLLWFWSTVFMAWVVTENPPSSQRGLLLVPAAALLAAWGFDTMWRYLSTLRRLHHYLLVVLICISIALNVHFYFGVYTPRRSYGNPTAEIATKIAQYTLENPQPVCEDAHNQQCQGAVYFLGPPRLYWEFGSLAFLLRNFPGQDVMPGELPLEITAPARFILIEGRIGEVGQVATAYPGGEIHHILDTHSQTIAIIYDWLP
jgi:4-amino-4-deoxy-L-arabinose transferase-like glycosyltransferase